MNSLTDILRARTDIQEIYRVSKIVPWKNLSQDHKLLFDDPETALSIVEMKTGNPDTNRMITQVIKTWETTSDSIRRNFMQFESCFTIAQLIGFIFERGYFPKNVHLAVCGNELLGIQGIMVWQRDRSSIQLHCLMTSPLNIFSPIANPDLRVKRVGDTCMRYLQEFYEDVENITLLPLPNSVPFYQRHGFKPGVEVPRECIMYMNWTRTPKP